MQAVFAHPQAEQHTAQQGKALLVASHFLIIIPYLGSWIHLWVQSDERLRREREWIRGGRKRGRDETFMRCGVGVGNHNENAKIELFSMPEGGVMRVKTAWRGVMSGRRSRGGSQGVKLASGCEEEKVYPRNSNPTVPLLLPLSCIVYLL